MHSQLTPTYPHRVHSSEEMRTSQLKQPFTFFKSLFKPSSSTKDAHSLIPHSSSTNGPISCLECNDPTAVPEQRARPGAKRQFSMPNVLSKLSRRTDAAALATAVTAVADTTAATGAVATATAAADDEGGPVADPDSSTEQKSKHQRQGSSPSTSLKVAKSAFSVELSKELPILAQHAALGKAFCESTRPRSLEYFSEVSLMHSFIYLCASQQCCLVSTDQQPFIQAPFLSVLAD